VEGILAGAFSSVPQDENRCRYCPNDMLCGKDDRRAACVAARTNQTRTEGNHIGLPLRERS